MLINMNIPFDNLLLGLVRLNEKVKNKPDKLITHVKRLTVALNVLIPPLRITYTSCLFHKSKDSPPADKKNYCWEYERDKYAFIIQQDKVDQKKERSIFYLSNEIQLGDVHITNGKLLNDYIVDSYFRYPRQYLLPKTNLKKEGDTKEDGKKAKTKPKKEKASVQVWSYTTIKASTYASFLNTSFDKPTNQTMIRESYVNWWYNKSGITNGMRKEIAYRYKV